jgi:hypothetical protein
METLEARIFEGARMHAVKSFVYYFPECYLVVKVADYTGPMTKDMSKLEFQMKAPGSDFRTLPVKGIRYE